MYGHHATKEVGGIFTSRGMLITGDSAEPRQVYRGTQDLPPEYRAPSPMPETERETATRAAPAERTSPGEKPSVLAEIAESREAARNKTPKPCSAIGQKPAKNKADPEH